MQPQAEHGAWPVKTLKSVFAKISTAAEPLVCRNMGWNVAPPAHHERCVSYFMQVAISTELARAGFKYQVGTTSIRHRAVAELPLCATTGYSAGEKLLVGQGKVGA